MNLEQRFEQVEAVGESQTVLDNADYIFLCILPQIAPQVLLPLNFRKEHIVVSVIAIRPLSEIREYVSPAHEIIRAVPLPPIAKHAGPVIFYPNHKKIAGLFASTAHSIPVSKEDDLIVLSAITGLIAPYYALLTEICKWAALAGVDEKVATEYSLAMFQAMSYLAIESGRDLKGLAAEAATPGGLNEQALRDLNNVNAFKPFLDTLDRLLQRLGLGVPIR